MATPATRLLTRDAQTYMGKDFGSAHFVCIFDLGFTRNNGILSGCSRADGI